MPCVIYYEFTAGLLTKAVIAFLHPAQPDLPTHGETRSLQCYRELKGLLSLKYGNGKEATRKEKPAYDVRRLAWKMKKAEESLDYYEDRYQSTREEAYLKYNNAMRDIQKAEDEDRITDNAYYTLALRRKQTRDKAVAEARSRIDEAKKTLSAVRKERIAEVWASISTDWSVANDSTIQLELSRCSGGFRLLATYEGRTGTAIGAVTSDL